MSAYPSPPPFPPPAAKPAAPTRRIATLWGLLTLGLLWFLFLFMDQKVMPAMMLDGLLPSRVLAATTPEERMTITQQLKRDRQVSPFPWIGVGMLVALSVYGLWPTRAERIERAERSKNPVFVYIQPHNTRMLHHLSFPVSDLARSTAFYDAALSALGYGQVWADDTAVGYGLPGGGDLFAIKLRPAPIAVPDEGFHVAFAAASREAVDKFYAAAIAQGGRDNGAPELCLDYGENYYAGFVLDPDGYRIEAVINSRV